MIVEQRTYRFKAGKVPTFMAIYEEKGLEIQKRILGNLTADRASRILADAVTNPRLMQSLLMDPASPRFEREALPRLLPYLVGGATAIAAEED